MKEKSIQKNAILNLIKTLSSVLFPLITYKYVAVILGVDNLGKIDFSNSIITYFTLFAALGIKSYAVREGAILRDNESSYEKFCNEVFSINIITTIISYSLLFVLLLFCKSLMDYSGLILLMSLSIMFTTLGVEWIYSIWEDYLYITVRSIAFQIISFILLFVLVRKSNDYYTYAFIIVLSGVGSNVLNYLYAKKYMKFKFIRTLNLKTHLKPLLIFFASSLATTIYVSSDVTVLGLLAGEYYTGLYSASSKVYSVIKKVLASVLIVSIPRLSYYINNCKKEEYDATLQNIANTLLILLIPAVVGLLMLSQEIILIISGENYLPATLSLQILSIALIFCIIAWFLSQCVLIPMKFEGIVFKITLLSAIINVVANCILVPFFKHNAAAFTTVLSEGIVAFIYLYIAKSYIHLRNFKKNLINTLIGCVGMAIVILLLKNIITVKIWFVLLSIPLAGVSYIVIMILLKNEIVINLLYKIKLKFISNKNY